MAWEIFLSSVSSSVCVQVRAGCKTLCTYFTNMFSNFVVDMLHMIFHVFIPCEDFSTMNTIKPSVRGWNIHYVIFIWNEFTPLHLGQPMVKRVFLINRKVSRTLGKTFHWNRNRHRKGFCRNKTFAFGLPIKFWKKFLRAKVQNVTMYEYRQAQKNSS